MTGNFLYDSGWYYESASVFRQVLYLAMENNDAEALIASLSCCEKCVIMFYKTTTSRIYIYLFTRE